MIRRYFFTTVAGLILLVFCASAFGDADCNIVQSQTVTQENGSSYTAHTLSIDNKTYVALPKEIAAKLWARGEKQDAQIKELQQLLEAADGLRSALEASVEQGNQLNEANDTLINGLTKVKEDYKDVAHDYQKLSTSYGSLADDYEDLTTKYKKISEAYRALAKGRTLVLDVGAGLTGADSDYDPAYIVGVGHQWFKAWYFHQEDNSGGMIGVSVSFP